MAKRYNNSDLLDVVRKGSTPPPCDLTLQLDVQYAEDGTAKGTWQVDGKFINGLGVVMGGYLASAADIMMAYAIASKLEADRGGNERSFASIDLHTTFHRPAFPGTVEIEARVERMGKTVAYVVADMTQNGKIMASAVSSVLITEVKS